ncbi:uncharacterized protein CMC5_033170 [Chondromyces crocatus]|uniref:Tail specific protease domain-containing protein n=1 Tax=Chondromyces crocatus TaxID=52 RepID=A0A0K1EE79_CHOCO|nr:uncharacterized protein CMC5_033170 [Chondromyces crocatus]
MPAREIASSGFSALALTGALALSQLGCMAAIGRASAPSWRIADTAFDRDPQAVSAAEAVEELRHVTRVFDEAYAGVDGGQRSPSAHALTRAHARVQAKPRWEPEELTRLLRDVFQRPDGHLSFGYGGQAPLRLMAGPRRRPYVTAPIERVDADGGLWLGEERFAGCTLGARGVEVLPTPEGRFVLGVFAVGPETAEVPCFSAEGAPAQLALHTTDAEVAPRATGAVTFTRQGEVPVLSIRTFDNGAALELDTLPAMAAALRTTPGFVLDLRGNGGGNYRYAEAFLLALTDEPMQRLSEREVRSAAAAEGRANSARRRLGRGDVPAEAEARFMAHIAKLEAQAEELRVRGAPREDVVTEGALVRGHAAGPLRARAVLLVDDGCASACEMLVSMARQLPSVIIAGQPTRGGMAVGEVALFQLPRSGIQVSLGTRAFKDALGDFEEMRGFLPDVWIEGDDPVSEAAALAQRREPAARGDAEARWWRARRGTGAGRSGGRRDHAASPQDTTPPNAG